MLFYYPKGAKYAKSGCKKRLVVTHNSRLYNVEVDKYMKAGYNAQKKALSILKGYDFQCVKK